jgi:hypothetical protein
MPSYVIYYNQGNTPGPFDVYLSGSSGLTLYASNISRYELTNGYLVTFPDGVPSSSIDVFDISYGCFTEQNVPFPSQTPSITPSVTKTPSVTLSISVSRTPSKTVSVSPTRTPSFTPPPSNSVTPTPTSTPGASQSTSPSPSPTRTPSATTPIVYDDRFYLVRPGGNTAFQACITSLNPTAYDFSIFIATPANITLSNPLTVGTIILTRSSNIPYTYSPFVGGNLYYLIDTWISAGGLGDGYFYQINNSGVVLNVVSQNCAPTG